jgi:hypothetical protein
VAIVVGAGAFFGGMKYGANKNRPSAIGMHGNFGGNENVGQRNGGQMQDRQRMGQNGGGFIGGSIISKDDKSITVKDQSGNSKIIFFSDSTAVAKSASGSSSDLVVGENVMVNGKANADGSIVAQNIQIRPDQPAQAN